MFEFLLAHAGVLGLLVIALVTTAALMIRSESLSLWLLSTWFSLPLIGGIASLARRQASRRLVDNSNAASSSVLALCSSYGRFIRVLNRADYDNYMNYLRKSGDLGIRPFPPYLRGVIFSMVLIEAAGLAYVLAGWTLPGASEFAQRIAALGIGFLIAVVLVFFTHWAGLEIDQVNRYRRDRNEWIAAGKVGPLYGPDLSLNDAQNVDDNEPAYRQRATRGHGKTTYVLTTITLLMVLAVGSGAAFVRGQVLEQEIVGESATRARTMQRFDFSVPETAAAGSVTPDQRAMQEEISIKRRGGWGTLVILMIIFFFLQLLSIFFGYRHSFNGRLSKEAYRALRIDSFSSYNELTQFYDRVADIAQSKVDRLQEVLEQKMRDGMGNGRSLAPYSFRDYLQARDAQRRDKPLGADPSAPEQAAVAPEVPATPVAMPVMTKASTTAPAQAAPVQTAAPAMVVPAQTAVPATPAPAAVVSAPPAVPVPLAHAAAASPQPPAAVPARIFATETPSAVLPAARLAQTAPETVRGQLFGELVGPAEETRLRTRLELAERLERERASTRGARNRTPAKRKGSGLVET